MLPYSNRSWSKRVAGAVIAATLIGLAVTAILIRRARPLDVAEIAFIVLMLLAVLPPNIAILRRPPYQAPHPPGPNVDRPESPARAQA